MQTRTWIYTLVCTIALLACTPNIRAAEEDDLIAALQPGRSAQDKDRACQRLKNIGTARAVPALAALLADEELSHSARYALESLPAPEAGAALCDALAKTTGMTRVGIITSLAERREAKATAALRELLTNDDAPTASAAAFALGRIGSKEAYEALRSADPGAAVDDALLLCAERRAQQDPAAAEAIYRELHQASRTPHVRTAALRGLVLAAGDKGIDLVVQALKSENAADIDAALQLVGDPERWNKPRLDPAETFAAVLPQVKPAVQIALLEALTLRGSTTADTAVLPLLQSESTEVRLAAIRSLGVIGAERAGPALVRLAARTTGPEQEAARQALSVSGGCSVVSMVDMLLDTSPKPSAAERAEIARAMGYQVWGGTLLSKLAKDEDRSVRLAALKSLAMLSDASIAEMIPLLSANDDAERSAAEAAILAACTGGENIAVAQRNVLVALESTKAPAVRIALLRIAGQFGGKEAVAAIRAALKDADPAIQDVALRTLSEHGTVDAADDLLALSRDEARALPQRILALRGYWRIVGSASIPADQRVSLCKSGLAASTRPEEKRLGLAILAQTHHADALKLAEQSADEPAIRAEAQSAAVRIAAGLAKNSPDAARAALKRIADNPATDALRTEARSALNELDQFSGYIATWSIAGPYRQAGKQCMELFDIAFAPEKADAAVKWRPLPPPADKALAWQADLLPQADGEQCVIYARARVHCPTAQDVRLDIGSDDGIKLWINGQLAHSNNTQRPIKAMNDRATAKLNAGWNDLLVKVTQNNMGFAFCLRIRAADGSVIEGLRSDTQP